MPQKRAKYPISPGMVFALDQSWLRFNKHIGAKTRHKAFLWIQKAGILKKGRPPKERLYKVLYYLIPEMVGMDDKYILYESHVQHETIGFRLKNGYKIISRDCAFNYTTAAYKKFYLAVGAIK